jgi:thiol-disulfide isomerase/thioredoxin
MTMRSILASHTFRPRSRHNGRRWPVWLVLTILALATAPAGFAAEEFRLPGLQGGQLTTADVARGNTALVVWASWSPRCRTVASDINGLASRWGGKVRIVAVNFQEERPAIESFLAGHELSVPVYLDSDGGFSKAHAVSTLPGLLIFRDGAVVYHGRFGSDADDVLREALQ